MERLKPWTFGTCSRRAWSRGNFDASAVGQISEFSVLRPDWASDGQKPKNWSKISNFPDL